MTPTVVAAIRGAGDGRLELRGIARGLRAFRAPAHHMIVLPALPLTCTLRTANSTGDGFPPAGDVLQSTLREAMSGVDHTGRRRVQRGEHTAERRFAREGHDFSEVLPVDRAVREHAILKATDSHDLDGLAVLELQQHLDEAHDAIVAGQSSSAEEVVQLRMR